MNPVWIGKFEVSARPENKFLEGDAGAFVWVAAQAASAENLVQRMTHAMKELGLTVVDSENVQEVIDETTLSDSVFNLLPEAKRNSNSVVCGTWHRFKNFDA
jgi:hypothetical protein